MVWYSHREQNIHGIATLTAYLNIYNSLGLNISLVAMPRHCIVADCDASS